MTALALPLQWQHIVAMPLDRLSVAVRDAIRCAPCSVRRLAEAADVPASTLVRILAEERAATPAVARAVVQALETWGTCCTRAARRIRQAYPKGRAP